MNYEKYQRLLANIITKAPLELGVQSIAFELLDEIIYERYGEDIVVLLADLRNQGRNGIFGGAGDVVDLCVVNNIFQYVRKPLSEDEINKKILTDEGEIIFKAINTLLKDYYECGEEEKKIEGAIKNEIGHALRGDDLIQYRRKRLDIRNQELEKEFEKQKKNRLGCVEIKATDSSLLKNIKQLVGHINEYRKVIYTNGLVWLYFDISKGKIIDETDDNIDKIKEGLRKIIYDEESSEIQEKVGFQWVVHLARKGEKNIIYYEDRKEIIINKENYNELVNNLKNINWESRLQTK